MWARRTGTDQEERCEPRCRVRGPASRLFIRLQKTMTTATPLLPHVLAIDDDPAMRELIADYLGENDLRVTTVATGDDMTRALSEHAIDAMVLDLGLAGEGGMELARTV